MNKSLMYVLLLIGVSSFVMRAADIDSAPNTPPTTPTKMVLGLTPETPPTPPTLTVYRQGELSPILVFNRIQMPQIGSNRPSLSAHEMQDVQFQLSEIEAKMEAMTLAQTAVGAPIRSARRNLMADFNLSPAFTEEDRNRQINDVTVPARRPALPPTWPVFK